MDEARFRQLMRAAVGEGAMPQWLATDVRNRLRAPQRTVRPRRLALAAMGIAFAVLAAGVLELQHVARQQSPPPVPAASPSASASPSPVAVDATHCMLPVWVFRESRLSNGPTIQVGFVDTATGAYTSDGSAPAGAQIVYYSHTFHKWLPVSSRQVSPDGLFYAWAQNAPRNTSSVLYIHDIAQGTDAKIWSRAGFADVYRWDAAGLLVGLYPLQGDPTWWLVDPQTGTWSAASPPAPTFPFRPLPGDPTNVAFGPIGEDGHGHTIWMLGNRDRPGQLEWVFIDIGPGDRVYIYKGSYQPAGGFVPFAAVPDSTGIWFADYDDNSIWHWQQGEGLRKVKLSGLPPLLAGSNSGIQVTPAGACF